jgi:peptide/nickel transport system ATP-binding protein
VLNLEHLTVQFKTRGKGNLKAVDDVSFQIHDNECLGIVGESGCGKTTIVKAVLKILPVNGEIAGGRILYKGTDLVPLTYGEMRKIRWKEISMITQDALNSLNPVHRVGEQIMEAITTHEEVGSKEAYQRAMKLFALVGIESKRFDDFPHQFSGGMRQRAIIAMALALNPCLIIADEPTTALDVIVQDSILEKIYNLQRALQKAMLLITHDVSVVVENCDSVLVMYAGKIVEQGRTDVIFTAPYHPYTLGLQNAFPSIRGYVRELISIPGAPPNLTDPPEGCRFHDRCPFSTDQCEKEEPPLLKVNNAHFSACHYPDRIDEFRKLAKSAETWQQGARKA